MMIKKLASRDFTDGKEPKINILELLLYTGSIK